VSDHTVPKKGMLPATLNMKKDESNDKDENQIETKLEEIPKVEKVSQHIS